MVVVLFSLCAVVVVQMGVVFKLLILTLQLEWLIFRELFSAIGILSRFAIALFGSVYEYLFSLPLLALQSVCMHFPLLSFDCICMYFILRAHLAQ